LCREARSDADIGNEKLVVLAAHRKSAEFRAAREERLDLVLKLRLDFHGSTLFPAHCEGAHAPGAGRVNPAPDKDVVCVRHGLKLSAAHLRVAYRLPPSRLSLRSFCNGARDGQVSDNAPLQAA